jgi:L-ribulose-5-phosphate 4-epimerase
MLPALSLVTFTWGNVSGIDRENGVVVIKPSGVEYDALHPDDMVAVDFLTGEKLPGETLNPSSDTATHLLLYRAFPGIFGVTHTHSRWATVMSQSGLSVPAYGTTHADHFYGAVPCTRALTADEIDGDYERNTGKVIAETFSDKNPLDIPAVLVKSHGPFTWGDSPKKSVENAAVLEEVCFMAWHNRMLNPIITPVPQKLLDKHYLRKHGEAAYYGQK